MIIYTDLYNRTKNYSLPNSIISDIERKFNVTITTIINPEAEVYWGDKLTDHHLQVMPNIKWIHLSKTGYGKFNLPKNALITNTPESSEGVAEFALTGILYLLRGLNQMTLDRKSFDSNIEYILPFHKVKCLIVGHGRIGKRLEELLRRLFIKTDKVTKKDNIKNILKSNSYNFIINCLPFNTITKNYFNKNVFNLVNSSYFINVGRGETVNEEDLYKALKNNNIKGAFLDVVQNEPLKPNNKLLKLDNVFISPHIANALSNSLDIQIKVFTDNLLKYKENQPLNNIIK
jgi:phosphoglycerate dehydrogenase-like enzyme